MIRNLFLSLVVTTQTATVENSPGDGSQLETLAPQDSQVDRAARVAYAQERFKSGHYTDAAIEFESLWYQFKVPRYLYNAAVARRGAGHLAHTAAHLDLYVRNKETPFRLRAPAKRVLREIQSQLHPIEVKLPPQYHTLRAEPIGIYASERRGVLTFRANHQLTVYLSRGRWKLTASSDDKSNSVQEIHVTESTQVQIRTQPKPVARGDLRITLMHGATGLAAILGGGIALGVGAKRLKSTKSGLKISYQDPPESFDTTTFRTMQSPSTTVAAGAGVLGSGIGIGTSGLVALLSNKKHRRRANVALIALGSGLLVAAIVPVSFVDGDRDDTLTELIALHLEAGQLSSQERADKGIGLYEVHTRRLAGSSLLLGLGGGLLVSSAVSLLLERPARSDARQDKLAVYPALNLGATSTHLSLTGTF